MKKTIVTIGLCVATALAVSAADAPFKMPAPRVTVGKVMEEKNVELRRSVGVAKPLARVDITTRVSADLLEIGFKDGDNVVEGQLLYRFDDTRYVAALQSAEASLAEAKALFDYAESSYTRADRLFSQNAASKDSLESVRSTYEAAKASLLAAEARLILAQDDLKNTKIIAPIAGKIGVTNYTAGNYLTPASGILATIVQSQPIRVIFSFSSKDYVEMFGSENNLKKEGVVRVRLADSSYLLGEGGIEFVNNEANSRTDTIQIFARFDNSEGKLIPNNTVSIELSRRDGELLPAVLPSAVMRDSEGAYVYVVDDANMPSRRNVVLGKTNGMIQIVLSGLKVGEIVIVDGTHKVIPNTPIDPDFGKMAGSTPVGNTTTTGGI